MSRSKPLTDRQVRALEGPCERALGGVPGLVVKVRESGHKSIVLRYRFAGRQCFYNLGAFPDEVSLGEARERAADLRRLVKAGRDPSAEETKRREVPTLAAAVAAYLEAITVAPRTLATYRLRLDKAVKAWGTRKLGELEKADVRRLHSTITKAGHPTEANRVVETLRAFFAWAADEWKDAITENPSRFDRTFRRNPEDLRTRIISPDERAALLDAIADAERKPAKTEGHLSSSYANAFRMALVTGMRPIDLVTLRHEHITRAISDGRKLWVAEWPAQGPGKTKKANQRRVLNSEAVRIIEAQAASTGGAGWVFPNAAGKQSTSNQLARSFRKVREAAGLPASVGLYVAGRHTYVSEGVLNGVPLPVMGADVDNASAVQRYAHLQRAVDEGVSERVLAALKADKS